MAAQTTIQVDSAADSTRFPASAEAIVADHVYAAPPGRTPRWCTGMVV